MTILTALSYGQGSKILRGITVDKNGNRFKCNIVIEETQTNVTTDSCGVFSVPIGNEDFTIVFLTRHRDFGRRYKINLKSKDVNDKQIVFQLKNWETANKPCKSIVEKGLKTIRIK